MSNKKRNGIIAGVVVVFASIFGLTVINNSSGCVSDAASAIASTPAGGTFTGTGCVYSVPNGVSITKPITIMGGTFNDPSTTGHPGVGYGGIQPVFRIKSTHNVLLYNLKISGGNPSGTFHSKQVGQAGIDVLSSDKVSVGHTEISNVFGDGITLWKVVGGPATTNFEASGVTITNAGRMGISPSNVNNGTFDSVTINKAGTGTAWDFESDIRGIGSNNVDIHLSKWQGIFNLIEPHSGISISDSVGSGLLWLGSNSMPASIMPDTIIENSTFYVLPVPKGRYQAGIIVKGSSVDIRSTNFYRKVIPSGKITAPLWSVTNGGTLSITGGTLTAPLGTNDATSTVNITP